MFNKNYLLLLIIILLSSCTLPPPKNINNACDIIHEYPDWYYDALNSYKKWGVPISTQFAIIRKESHFVANAAPPMKYFLGIIPIGRATSAYGYAQAIDSTWDLYKKSTHNYSAKRNDFADVTDFIGWYGNRINKLLGISKSDTYRLYLAYHQGISGYKKGNYNYKIKEYAKQTQNWAWRYAYQLKHCKIPAKGWFW